MYRYEQQFKLYREWCKVHNIKPGHATSLEAYKEHLLEIKKIKKHK